MSTAINNQACSKHYSSHQGAEEAYKSQQDDQNSSLGQELKDSLQSQVPQAQDAIITSETSENTPQKVADVQAVEIAVSEQPKKKHDPLAYLDDLLKSFSSTLKGANETVDACGRLKDQFGTAINQMIDDLDIGSITGDQGLFKTKPKEDEHDMKPKVSDAISVANELSTKSHIVFLTGAGLSVASKIPTFRGEGGIWTLRNKQEKIKASDFLTHRYFLKAPEEVWRWHHELKKVQAINSPNVSHDALADFQVFCSKNGRKSTLITQNVDDYHVQAYANAIARSQMVKQQPVVQKKLPETRSTLKAKTIAPKVSMDTKKSLNQRSVQVKAAEESKTSTTQTSSVKNLVPMKTYGLCDNIYEIHGNINFMRCDKGCVKDLFPAPDVGVAVDFVPSCPHCGGIARPHTLFFDETYEDCFYRRGIVLDELKSMDCLVVVGTALETSLAIKIVNTAISNKCLVIEINPNPCITYGDVRHLLGGAESFIPIICQNFQKNFTAKTNIVKVVRK